MTKWVTKLWKFPTNVLPSLTTMWCLYDSTPQSQCMLVLKPSHLQFCLEQKNGAFCRKQKKKQRITHWCTLEYKKDCILTWKYGYHLNSWKVLVQRRLKYSRNITTKICTTDMFAFSMATFIHCGNMVLKNLCGLEYAAGSKTDQAVHMVERQSYNNHSWV